jgi:peptidoglycan/LPS O-acetylase OafA/YrhL
MNQTSGIPMVNGRIASLDGLRAIAVGLVLAGHAADAYLGAARSLWWVPVCNSSLGVRLFFVLSGFLITGLLVREQEKHGKISLRDFYIRRSLRIFPAFYLFLGVIGLLAIGGWLQSSWQQSVGAATYTWNYLHLWYRGGPQDGSWFMGHLWTLSLEEQFYLLWPGLIILCGWARARWICLAIPLLMPGFRIAWYFLFPDQRGYLGMMFHTAIDSILIGCAFALWGDRLWRGFAFNPWVLALALLFVFVVSPVIAEHARPYRITVGLGLDAVAVGILILQAGRRGWWNRLLSVRAFVLVGTWSYSLYLWQQLFLTPRNPSWAGAFPASFLALTACALASFYFVEKPILRHKKRFEKAKLGGVD